MFGSQIFRTLQRLTYISAFGLASLSSAIAECPPLIMQLNAALSLENVQNILLSIQKIQSDASCTRTQIELSKAGVGKMLLQKAAGIQNDGGKTAEYARLVGLAEQYSDSFEASWRLGDIEMKARNYAIASRAYQKAVDLLSVELKTQPNAAEAGKLIPLGRYLVMRANEARLLAASAPQAAFVAAPANHRGELGGAYSTAFAERGIATEKLPPPITFLYDSASFTPVGSQAADELVGLLKQRNVRRVSIIGHTDQKGSDEYNLALSLKRAQAVAAFLKERGLDATFVTTGKGKREPRTLSSDAGYTPDEVDLLNRRVEVEIGQ